MISQEQKRNAASVLTAGAPKWPSCTKACRSIRSHGDLAKRALSLSQGRAVCRCSAMAIGSSPIPGRLRPILRTPIQIVRHCFMAREAARSPGLSMPGRVAFWLAGSCVWSSPTSSRISIRRTALTFARREKCASARSWRGSALIGKRMCQHSARPWSRFAPCLQPSPIWAVRFRPTPIMPFSAVSSGRDASVHSHCCLRKTRCGRGAIGCFRHLADLPAKHFGYPV